jgi:hypothetical protein
MSGTNQLDISNSPVGPPQFVAYFSLDQALSHDGSLQLKRNLHKIHERRAVTINRLLLAQPVGIGLPVWALNGRDQPR